jgi:hypothetical protein
VTRHQDYPLGGFDWLDKKVNLRRWFANWLAIAWRNIYWDSLRQLHSKTEFDALTRFEQAVTSVASKLPQLSTAEQLAAIDAEARKINLQTTRDRVEFELRYFLKGVGLQPKNAAAFKASPWCGHFATEKQILEQAGHNLPKKLYPGDPDSRLALESVIVEFGSFEISREVSPALRVRRNQRALYYAIRRLCKPKNGPAKLATFIQNLLKEWPRVPAGMEFDLENHFNDDKCRELVRGHLGLPESQTNKEAHALRRVLHVGIFRDELRKPLLRLADDADLRAKQRRKGWGHLRQSLEVVFKHIRREASDEAKFRNFERSNFPHMRNLTRVQRMRLLPELGNDPDHSVRDLTKKERMILAARYLKKTRTALEKDADGKNSFATRYGRAMKDVRKELGQV